MNEDGPDRETMQRVYEYAISARQYLSESTIQAGTGLPPEQVSDAVRGLRDMGLLLSDPLHALRAVAPDDAVDERVGPLEREIRARRAFAERTRESIMSFLPVFETTQISRERKRDFEVLEELAEVRGVIADLTARARVEILTGQPGGARKEAILSEAAPRDRDALARGVKMRVLYQHTARFSLGTAVYIEEMAQLGAQVRTLDDHFSRLLVFDDEAAVISLPGNPQGAAVVREPNLIAFIKETYERLWLAAETYALGSRSEVVDDIRQAIVRLLTEGLTDASIARRLGMSVRTCRRHIADVMAELGANSRFQAGYLLAARGQPE